MTMKGKHVFLWMLSFCLGLCPACSDNDNNEPEPGTDPVPVVTSIKTSVMDIELSTEGGQKSFTVTTEGKGWTMGITGDLEGIVVSPEMGAVGKTEISLTAEANNQEDARTGILKIYLEDRSDSAQVAVRQSGIVQVFNRHTDSLALIAIYEALNGANWSSEPVVDPVSLSDAKPAALASYPWNLSLPITQWGGVQTELVGNEWRVTGFTLEATAGVEGVFPAKVTDLRELKSLVFTNLEKVSGDFPADIYRLTKCEKLSCRNMVLLKKWPVPERISEMTALRELTLQGLEIGLTEFTKLFVLENLESLSVNDGSMKGEMPEGITRMSKLQVLNLNNCSRISKIADDVCDLPVLRELHLGGCSALTALPERLGNLKKLEVLYLTNSKKLNSLPVSFADLTALKDLNISNMSMIGDADQLFTKLVNMEELRADNNNFTGSLNWLKGMKSLKLLVMSAGKSTELTLSGELKISELFTENITHLLLDGHRLTGTLAGIGKLKKLSVLALSNCMLGGNIPAEMAQLTLVQGSLANNNLEGNIPEEMAGFIERMAVPLFLNGNKLGGEGISLPPAVAAKWTNYKTYFCQQQAGYGFTDCN